MEEAAVMMVTLPTAVRFELRSLHPSFAAIDCTYRALRESARSESAPCAHSAWNWQELVDGTDGSVTSVQVN